MATHWGKVHDYLGMIFDFSLKGKVMVTMMEYIKNIITRGDRRDKNVPCRGPSLHSEGPIPGEGAAGRAGDGIPSYDGVASVPEHEGAVGHSACHCFSDHTSKVAG
jgi:hypothetical protein